MSVSFQELRKVAEAMGQQRKQNFVQLLKAEHNEIIWSRLAEELLHLFDRFVDFASAPLHSVSDSEVMFILSSHFLQVTKLDLSSTRREFGGRLPLPATEAISNQLLILAETDPPSYLLAYAMLSVYVLPVRIIREHLPTAPLSEEVKEELLPFLDYQLVAKDMVKRCEPFMGTFTDREKQKILNQLFVLLETADCLEEELLTYEKLSSLPQIS